MRGFEWKGDVEVGFQQKGLIRIFLDHSLWRAWSSLHFIRSLYHFVGVDFSRVRLKDRDFNEEFDCEIYTKSLFMVCGRDFDKRVIEKVVLMWGENGGW